MCVDQRCILLTENAQSSTNFSHRIHQCDGPVPLLTIVYFICNGTWPQFRMHEKYIQSTSARRDAKGSGGCIIYPKEAIFKVAKKCVRRKLEDE